MLRPPARARPPLASPGAPTSSLGPTPGGGEEEAEGGRRDRGSDRQGRGGRAPKGGTGRAERQSRTGVEGRPVTAEGVKLPSVAVAAALKSKKGEMEGGGVRLRQPGGKSTS